MDWTAVLDGLFYSHIVEIWLVNIHLHIVSSKHTVNPSRDFLFLVHIRAVNGHASAAGADGVSLVAPGPDLVAPPVQAAQLGLGSWPDLIFLLVRQPCNEGLGGGGCGKTDSVAVGTRANVVVLVGDVPHISSNCNRDNCRGL